MAKKKRLFDEDGNEATKTKKPFYKRWWFIGLVVLFILAAIGGSDEEAPEPTEPGTEEVETAKETEAEEPVEEEVEVVEEKPAEKPEEVEAEEPEEVEEEIEEEVVEEEPEVEVSREQRNALSKAESYLSWAGMSEKGLREQLEFEDFPQDAIDYALANVSADYNEQALTKAKSYDSWASMSDSGLKEQLLFEGFTEAQAQYALDNLD